MEIQEIIKTLEILDDVPPDQALEEACARKEEIIPELVNIVRYAIDNKEEILNNKSYVGHIYALYLLGQFQVKEAAPLILELVSLSPEEKAFDLFGDLVSEWLGRILIGVLDGDDQPLKNLIENEGIHPHVRHAALDSWVTMVVWGLKTRSEVIDYFGSLIKNMNRNDSELWTYLAYLVDKLHPKELIHDFEKLFEEGVAYEDLVDFKEMKKTYNQTTIEQKLEALKSDFFDQPLDAQKEFQGWCQLHYNDELDSFDKKIPKDRPVTIKRSEPKIGRNDPCPCGSGKKYKKCCGK